MFLQMHTDNEFTSTSEAENGAVVDMDREQSCVDAQGSQLAMWEAEIQNIELEKGSSGLGFSILDYQVGNNNLLTVV